MVFQLVVPVSFGWQWRLCLVLLKAIQAAFRLQGGEQGVKASRAGGEQQMKEYARVEATHLPVVGQS